MSHLKEREEKVCLNCGSELSGRYCHNCGQENVEPKESAWHLINHFFSDLFHFDGKFFSTLKLLALKPGFLTEQYVKGRRAAYLNPIRMYLFVSAVFFLVLMSFVIKQDGPDVVKITETKNAKDSVAVAKMGKGLKNLAESFNDSLDEARLIDTSKAIKITLDDTGDTVNVNQSFLSDNIHSYDSLQKALPENERHGKIKRHFARKIIIARAAWREHPTEMKRRFVAGFFHSLPYMLFISLPLIALLLKLLYIRRKDYYYVSHAIFTVNFYIFVFITLLLKFLIEKTGAVGEILGALLSLSIYIYLFMAMKRFYKQGGFKTFVKFVLFGFLGSFIVGMLAIVATINTAINVAGSH